LNVLSELMVGESGVLVSLDLPESVQNHLMHMGFVPDALVTSLRRAPAGDPTVYCVDGLEIALRRETAAAIQMREVGVEQETDEDGIEFMDSQVRKSGAGAPAEKSGSWIPTLSQSARKDGAPSIHEIPNGHEIPERIEATR
jgi:Fe2+ transport system protein FeoA